MIGSEPYTGLYMFEARKQMKRRGSINAAYARVDGNGLADARVLTFQEMWKAYRGRPHPGGIEDAFEALVPRGVDKAVKATLSEHDSLTDPGPDPVAIGQRIQTLQQIRGKGSSKSAREAVARCERTVTQRFQMARDALERVYAQAADKSRTVVDQSREVIRNLVYPPISNEPLAQLQRVTKASEQLRARKHVLPPGHLENITVDLIANGRRLCDEALREVARELSHESLQRGLNGFEKFLHEIGQRGTEFERRLSQVLTILEERQRQSAQDQHVSRASVIQALTGPDEKQILAGMMGRAGCADQGALAQHLLVKFEATVRELAPALAPWCDAANDPFPDLVRALEAKDLADAFSRLIDGAVGPGQTLYETIAKHGLREVAKFLFHRSKPMCHLSGRDIESLRVQTHDEVIVRLPPPTGPRDPAIRADLISALSKLGPCTFRDGAVSDTCVTIVRINLGWPIAIESDTKTLLFRYLQAGEAGHPPHLVGFLPESPHGERIESYRVFAQSPQPATEVNP